MNTLFKNSIYLQYLYNLKLSGETYIDDLELLFSNQKNSNNQDIDISKITDINELKKVSQNCQLCDLSLKRKDVIFGKGNVNAKIVFIGDIPEEKENFIGRAGELLIKMIEKVLELSKDDVYITNIVKCRPDNNRGITTNEATTCKDYLFKQIEFIKPKIVITLGSTSYHYFTDDIREFTKVRGNKINMDKYILIPTYSPSYLLKNEDKKLDTWKDLLLAKGLL